MAKKKDLFFVVIAFFLGFYLIGQGLGQTPFVTSRTLELSRSVWTLCTPRDYRSGDSLLTGDYLYPNLRIYSSGRDVTISEKEGTSQNSIQIEVGEVSEDFYLDSPLYIYNNNRSVTAQWWFYWLNSSYLDSNIQFNLPLENGGKLFLNSLLYLEGDWAGNETLLTLSPLTMRVNQIADKWVLSGSDNYNSTDNHLVNRNVSFIYDMDGYLLVLEGDMYITQNIYFYRNHFSWRREMKLTTQTPLESVTDDSTVSFLFLSIILAVIVLFRLKRK